MRLVVWAVLAVLCLPVAAAQLPAEAAGLGLSGAVRMEGDLAGLSVNSVPTPDTDGGRLDGLQLHGKQGYVLHWTETVVVVPGADDTVPAFGVALDDDFQRYPAEGMYDQLRLHGGEHDDDHLLNVIPRDSVRFLFTGSAQQGDAASLLPVETGLCLHNGGLKHPQTTACEGYDEHLAQPTSVPMPVPGQHAVADAGGRFQIAGDLLVLDLLGIDLASPDGDLDLAGRGQPGAAPGTWYVHFMRVVLVDGMASFRVDGNHDQVAWVAQDVSSEVEGTITFDDPRGRLLVGGEPVEMHAPLTGSFLLQSRAQEETVAFDIAEPAPPAVASVGTASSVAPAVTLAGLLSLLPLFGIALTVRRTRAHTTMGHVEKALGRGRYERAARLAGRLVRADPSDESAHLGRAIALTKSGRAASAVEDLDALLAEHEPRDGTLHYALGVALRDLGRQEEARAAMARAVERTPALLDRMEPDMRPRFDTGAYT